jgi:hypothetical protein
MQPAIAVGSQPPTRSTDEKHPVAYVRLGARARTRRSSAPTTCPCPGHTTLRAPARHDDTRPHKTPPRADAAVCTTRHVLRHIRR